MGAYHGKYGFDTFTHKRAVVQMPDWLDRFMGFRYPPYDLTKSNPMTTFSAPPFKRGETLQDQKSEAAGVAWTLGTAVLVGGLAVVLVWSQRLI